MWHTYWKLSGDPFLGPSRRFVATSSHEEAVVRVLSTIESAQPIVVVRGGSGLGKSVVVAEACARARGPRRRIARLTGPRGPAEIHEALAEGLGRRVPRGSGPSGAWTSLVEAVRLCHWQGVQPVLVLDGADELPTRELERLLSLAPGRLTLVLTVREPDRPVGPSWQLVVRVLPMTMSDTVRYVESKLEANGRDEPAFTPRAVARLHDLSGGVPRGIDRLASMALMAGAWRGLELVPPEVVDGVALECLEGRPELADEAGFPSRPAVC